MGKGYDRYSVHKRLWHGEQTICFDLWQRHGLISLSIALRLGNLFVTVFFDFVRSANCVCQHGENVARKIFPGWTWVGTKRQSRKGADGNLGNARRSRRRD
jgi:hypothetical protein